MGAAPGRARLATLVETSRRLTATRARRQKVDLLADRLGKLAPAEVPLGVAYLSGALPQGKLGLGYAALRAAWPASAATEPTLSLAEVDAELTRIAAARGPGSAKERERRLRELLRRATREEQEYLGGLVLGELRQGALEGLVLEAVAQGAGVAAGRVRRAFLVSGDLGAVARATFEHGEISLDRFDIRLLEPLQPMLAQRAEDVADALSRLGRAGLEFKLDGARIQVHKRGDEVRVFTRGLNEVTGSVPEVVEAARGLAARELVLDGETLALRPDGRPHPFQATMRRFGRKRDDPALRASLPLSPFFFDCLYLDGTRLLDAAAAERWAALLSVVPEPLRVRRLETDDMAEAEAFAAEAWAAGHEGLVAKSLSAPYEAGSRGAGWLKVKRAHTLDLVVLAAEWGSGRRRGYLSNLHLGARHPATGSFVMLGKTFKGLTDKTLAWQTERLQQIEQHRDRYTVFVRPELVVEIAFDGVQQSPHYPAGLTLRFARVKGYRDDKTAGEADTIDTVRALFAAQSGSIDSR
jgi:DNA ligase-1